MKTILLRDIVRSINEDDCPVSYNVISQALHSLAELGEHDLEKFKMGFIRKTLTEKESAFMQWHIKHCKFCLDDILFKAKISAILHVANDLINTLKTQAAAYAKEDKYAEAIKCLEEALELRPGDEEIGRNLIRLFQNNSGDPLKRDFVVWVNDKVTEYKIIKNELLFYLYKKVDEIEDKNVIITKDDEIYFSPSFHQNDIRIYQLAADTGDGKDQKKSKARVIKKVDFRRKPYRKINCRIYINSEEGYAKAIIELPS